MALDAAELYARVRQLGPELLKFGIVGGTGTVVDLGGAALLHGVYHVGPLEAKAASTSAATVITYLGSRFWTFKDRENQELKREAVLFIVLNLVGLLIAEVVVGVVTYAMSLHGQLEYNIASFLGTGFGTIFRYFAYKKWVFLAPGGKPAATAAPARRPFSRYTPWEPEPAFLAPTARAPRASRAPVGAPALSPAREQEPVAWDPALAPTMSWNVPVPQPAVPQPAAVRAPDFPARGFPPGAPPARDFPARNFPGAPPARGFPGAPPARNFPGAPPARTFPADAPPARDFPARGFPADASPARDFPADAFHPPAQPPRRPAPARPLPPHPSGGGRHRKS